MPLTELEKQWRSLCRPYRVVQGKDFSLASFRARDTGPFKKEDKQRATEVLDTALGALPELQEKLYANHTWAVLLIFQAMDAAGKDSLIKHVMSGLNPQSCQVRSFKAPAGEELSHDYLWRCVKWLPERGSLGIFNRSYYEEVLVVQVHPEFLERQNLPPALITEKIWQERYQDICNFERYLSHNGYVIRKFFLHLSKEEQRRRLLKRLDSPQKNWKFSLDDLHERKYWNRYMSCYENMIKATASEQAPWYVVPADNKWYTRAVVSAALLETLSSLDLSFPKLSPLKKKKLSQVRSALLK